MLQYAAKNLKCFSSAQKETLSGNGLADDRRPISFQNKQLQLYEASLDGSFQ